MKRALFLPKKKSHLPAVVKIIYNKNPLKTSKNLATILVIVYTNSI